MNNVSWRLTQHGVPSLVSTCQYQRCGLQVLGSTLPVGLARVDCAGDESSLLQCSSVSSYAGITFRRNSGSSFGRCARLNSVTLSDDITAVAVSDARTTDSTVLACGDTSGGMHPSHV